MRILPDLQEESKYLALQVHLNSRLLGLLESHLSPGSQGLFQQAKSSNQMFIFY